MAVSVLLAILGGELLLQRNYGRRDAHRGWPRQPVAPALLTATVVASLLLAGAIAVTAFGEAALDRPPSWIPTAAATAAVAFALLPATLAVRRRQGISTTEPGLDAALRAITAHRIVRTLAAFLAAEAGGLLITASYAWTALLEPHATPSQDWMPAVVAGAVLVAAGAVISVIPVRRLAGNAAPSAPPVQAEPVR
jgi:TRAP-type C4-dicarboxylate transport system permease small subunit